MTKKTNLLLESSNPHIISKFRFYSGLLLGIGYSCIFYFLLYSTREILRVFWVSDFYDIWILNEQEVAFYNLFYAFVSTILGQSICFTIWFETPKRIYERNYRRRISIITDHKVLNWFFLAWFSKLAVSYAAIFGASYSSADFYIFSFYPKYNYVFVLIIIVLFLQTWLGVLLKYKLTGTKWMLIAASIVTLISIGLSKINLVDSVSYNAQVLSSNIYERYDLILPESDYFKRRIHPNRFERIFLVNKDYGDTSTPLYIMDNEHCTISELALKLLNEKNKRPQELQNILQFQLNIAPNVKMDHVERLKRELAYLDTPVLAYGVVPTDHPLDRKYYKGHIFPVANYAYYEHVTKDLGNTFKITITPLNSGNYLLNRKQVSTEEVRTTVADLIKTNPNFVIQLKFYSNTLFEDYFAMLLNARSAILDLRNAYSENQYKIAFDELPRDYQREVMSIYPSRIMDIRMGEFPFLQAPEKSGLVLPPLPPYAIDKGLQ